MAAFKDVNYKKVHKVIQEKYLSSTAIQGPSYNRNLDSETPEGKQLLMTHIFSQSFPDIKAKLKYLQRGPLISQSEDLAVAFKLYHGRDEKAHKQKYLMMAKDSELAQAEAQKTKNLHILVKNVVRRVTGSRIPGG